MEAVTKSVVHASSCNVVFLIQPIYTTFHVDILYFLIASNVSKYINKKYCEKLPALVKSEAFTRNKLTSLIPTSLDTYYSPVYKKMDTFYPFISYKNQPASWLVEMLFTISTTYGVGNFWSISC
jgi:hypothetical protein